MATLTEHSAKRGKQRLGLGTASVLRMAEMALEKGIRHADTAGSLRRYMNKLFLEHRTGNNTRIYGEKIFIFRDEVLITVLDLPRHHRETVRKIRQAKKEALA